MRSKTHLQKGLRLERSRDEDPESRVRGRSFQSRSPSLLSVSCLCIPVKRPAVTFRSCPLNSFMRVLVTVDQRAFTRTGILMWAQEPGKFPNQPRILGRGPFSAAIGEASGFFQHKPLLLPLQATPQPGWPAWAATCTRGPLPPGLALSRQEWAKKNVSLPCLFSSSGVPDSQVFLSCCPLSSSSLAFLSLRHLLSPLLKTLGSHVPCCLILFWLVTETDFSHGCSELYWLLVCLSPALGKHWALLDRLIVLDLPAHNPWLSKRNRHARRKKAMNACIR